MTCSSSPSRLFIKTIVPSASAITTSYRLGYLTFNLPRYLVTRIMAEQDQANSGHQPIAPVEREDPDMDGAAKHDSESEDEDWSDDSVPFIDERTIARDSDKAGQPTTQGKTPRRQSFPAYPFRQHRRDDRLGLDGHPGPLSAPGPVTAGAAKGSKSEGTRSRLSGSDRPPTRSTPSTSGSYYPTYFNSTPLPYLYPCSTLFGPAMPGVYPPPVQQYYIPTYPPPYPTYPELDAQLPGKLIPESRPPPRRCRESPETQRHDGGRRRHGHRSRSSNRDRGHPSYNVEPDKHLGTPHPNNVVTIRGSYDIDRPQQLPSQDIGAAAVLQQVMKRVERLELTVATHQTLNGTQNSGYRKDNQGRMPAQDHMGHPGRPHLPPPDCVDQGQHNAILLPFHNSELKSIEIEPNMNNPRAQSSRRGSRRVSRSPATASMITQSNTNRKSPKPRPPSLSSSRKAAHFEEVSEEDDSGHYTFKLPPPRASKDGPPSTSKFSKEEYDSAGEPVSLRLPRKQSPPKVHSRGSPLGHSKKPRVEQRPYPPVPPAVPDAPPS
ncbi:hypothetical protein QBC37DRAFT_138224 [Rhypophila decipiens]|uniref:Uncharacterized protein n=1 Tax=Rhypophila decipiens TaxID=261697 RepID=A0AAN6YFC2_9PEZI|nr:hypothetical protein QBC37DRAFT_138224 [Rhypophila decipiens]